MFKVSNPSANGVSVNNILHPGHVLQADLPVLVLRWRLYRYVFSAGIEKMIRQILIHPNQTPFQWTLLRKNTEVELKDYELNMVTLGVNCLGVSCYSKSLSVGK